jgi:hypothetical protein
MRDSPLPWPRAEIPAWAEFIAQDRDCAWRAYEAHPNEHDTGWYETSPRRQRLGRTAAPADCHATLLRLKSH